ncbi:MAG: DAK2 domain-containing protein [Streptosporangiaceae bacterium]
MLETLDAEAVRRWCHAAADVLAGARDEIDALNIFPVPDGDTGTNLHLTMVAAAKAADTALEHAPQQAWDEVTRAVLLGARGNSGVIVSQVLRGLGDVLGDARPCRGTALREGLRYGTELAYTAVAHPVEGTVLSVARAASDAAGRVADEGLAPVARAAAEGARVELAASPDRLDVLRRAGVVDAGGAGLSLILDALLGVITGEEIPPVVGPASRPPAPAAPCFPAGAGCAARYDGPAYEVMYLLDTDRGGADLPVLRSCLDSLGDSLVVVGGEGLWNIHVHVDDPGAALEAGLDAGRPHRIRVSYLRGESPPEVRGSGVAAVVAGEGLARLFRNAGATPVRREPGHPPRIEAVLDAVRSVGDEVTLLPGDRGLHPMAEVVAERARAEGVHVAVIPTSSSVQGLAALAVHDAQRRFDDDVLAMTAAAGATRAAEVVVASGAAVTSVGVCWTGDVLGLIEGDVTVIGSAVADVARQVIDRMLSGGGEVVTIITGGPAHAGVADRLRAHVHRTRPDVDTLAYEGGDAGDPLQLGVE